MNENMDDEVVRQQDASALDNITAIRVKFDAGETTYVKTLYGNGRMQVKVQVLVAGADSNGNPVPVPNEVMDSIKLIHYDTGRTLRDGWSASTEQGRFTLEAQTIVPLPATSDDDADDADPHPRVRTFWVSSSVAGTARVAARLALRGTTIRSNGTSLASVHDSSVTLEAQLPLTYSVEQFRWSAIRRGNEEGGNRIWNHYLGLYPQGQQIKLVDWVAEGVVENGYVADGNKLHEDRTNYLEAVLMRPENSEFRVSLPFNGSVLAYRHYANAVTSESKLYKVRVNDRDGELTVVQASSEYSTLSVPSRRGGRFGFRAIDQFGTEHKLVIRMNFSSLVLTLERG